MTWKLPEGWTIVLSSNPDDGNYNVTDQDPAQRSRYMNVTLKWDAEVWAKWAEKIGVDSRCINFVLLNKEIVNDQTPEVNARSITKFFNVISTISDFDNKNNLKLIMLLAEGSLGPEVASQFTSFVHNKMDKLITSTDILDPNIPFEKISKRIGELVQSGTKYRSDIAYVLTTRLMNHIDVGLSPEDITQDMVTRVEELITADLLGSDLKFVMGRKIVNSKEAFNSILFNDKVVANILE